MRQDLVNTKGMSQNTAIVMVLGKGVPESNIIPPLLKTYSEQS